MKREEKSSCGVGFVASRNAEYSHQIVVQTLQALKCNEHRGACSSDQVSGDGSGIMTDIPFELFGYEKGNMAVAVLFAPQQVELRRQSLAVFEDTFEFFGLKILGYREVPTRPEILGRDALKRMPYILQVFIHRPDHCHTNSSFDKLLYTCKQFTRTKQLQKNIPETFFPSLSTDTIVYKALTKSVDLERFYPDLQNPLFKSRFGLFHRRFSTNTTSTWDRVQPFRLIAHNGEFNTITGNRSWAMSREKALGLFEGELLMPEGVSDSGSLNEMVEALKYRSSIPHLKEVLAIMMPPATRKNNFYEFWSRAMEPWDGPALVAYSNGRSIGARLDRNGFRPCRWALTEDSFYLSSEAGSFHLNEETILQKGTLQAGSGINLNLQTGLLDFNDPSLSAHNIDFQFDKRTFPLYFQNPGTETPKNLNKKYLFEYSQEDLEKVLYPMILEGKEPIGSMGDTARLAVFSEEPRSFFDYFYHNFAQVTNPPLDYLREKNVTDLVTYLGTRPNIFAKKELIPPPFAFELSSPIISLGQMEELFKISNKEAQKDHRLSAKVFDITFNKTFGYVGFLKRLEDLKKEVKSAVQDLTQIIILSDEKADYEHPAIPCLIALRSIVSYLKDSGLRLKFSIMVHSAEIRSSHQVATTIGMGAAAVCPYLALEIARYEDSKLLNHLDPETKEKNLIKAFQNGLLKIMSKMGISVVRSYQSSLLFSSIGIDTDLIDTMFKGVTPVLSGIGLEEIVNSVIERTESASIQEKSLKIGHSYLYKEHNKGTVGEKHAMTNSRSKIVHDLVRSTGKGLDNPELYQEYLKLGEDSEPYSIRHLLQLKQKSSSESKPMLLQSMEEILQTFGSGAMSFGAISAEAQRDIILAMQEIGGRSNSGEGGENPYYHTEGLSSSIKQIASGRFGVNALYLVSGNEIQIKIAQGAKPGEGGQLLGVKVTEDIAYARNAMKGTELISPPPMHDIYSIEDLKELIYELKQLKPTTKVSVKLVSGAGVGTIAVGVAKAGADIIHISGGDGGTGAAALSSMKHTGLPWEYGLWEAHQALMENGLRQNIVLRTDGGLHTGKDVVMAAILGAEEFDFGKLMLVAQGCVMARICEKNTCPTGIATHDPRFKAKYKGTKDHIVKMLQYIAEDVRRYLALTNFHSLKEIIGRTDLLEINPTHLPLIKKNKIKLNTFLDEQYAYQSFMPASNPFSEGLDALNLLLVQECSLAIDRNIDVSLKYPITVNNRATLATLHGALAWHKHIQTQNKYVKKDAVQTIQDYTGKIKVEFNGSAGQGFGVFMTDPIEVHLYGEANDAVCKGMSGGKMVIVPSKKSSFEAEKNVIIGNVALYGATGGTLYVKGIAGDRFAVRNSGAVSVVEGVGLHACEYMTKGKIVILGECSYNVGGGMTGGEVFIYHSKEEYINHEYLAVQSMDEALFEQLLTILEDYHQETGSQTTDKICSNWEQEKYNFTCYRPLNQITKPEKVLVRELVEVGK